MFMKWTLIIVSIFLTILASSLILSNPLIGTYESFSTYTITDRYNTPIYVSQNSDNNYFLPIDNYPDELKNIVLKKEDRFFYYHPGVNPFSLLRTTISGLKSKEYGGSSTITQQLV